MIKQTSPSTLSPVELAQTALPGLVASSDVVELLGNLLLNNESTQTGAPLAQTLRTQLGEATLGFESARISNARSALDAYLLGHKRRATPALLEHIVANKLGVAFMFGGQASAYFDELAHLYASSFAAKALIDAMADALEQEVSAWPIAWSLQLPQGLDLRHWLVDPQARPDAAYLASSAVSQPLIFATQIAHATRLLEDGYGSDALLRRVRVAAGHSQGVMGALFLAETFGAADTTARATDYARYMLYQGLRMQEAFPRVSVASKESANPAPSPMMSVNGLTHHELEAHIQKLHLEAYVTLDNTRLRKIVSGEPAVLEALRRALLDDYEAKRKAKNQGRYAGALPPREVEFLPVGAPFHSPFMQPAALRFREDVARLGFAIDATALKFPVLDTSTGEAIDAHNLSERLVAMQFLEPVRFAQMVHSVCEHQVGVVLDCGPGDGVMRLTAANVRGKGVLVLATATEQGRRAALDSSQRPKLPLLYQTFAPTLISLPNGQARIDNAFTRWTGRAPVILPGMTPTTVDADIVVAAANAGFVSELAGGGQVTADMLGKRLNEVSKKLDVGQSVVFNALYMDPYLWRLHFGPDKLLLRHKRAGAPIVGVTVSAGIPPTEEAVAFLRELCANGIWLNALKPGNDGQIKQVLAIADACPDVVFTLQLEGGKAGGHHSREDLDDLLLRHYDAIRARKNLLLAVGGGIGTQERGWTYLSGEWAHAYSAVAMPVDAIFVGTVAMAALEAKTSQAVKAALTQAPGTERWVLDDVSDGGVTSGKSQLDASIYYLDNAAARAGRLLDGLVKHPEKIATHKAEIVAALSHTAKPYLGDMEGMTVAAFLRRVVSLFALGTHGNYDDGAFLDITHRRRVVDTFRLVEARLVTQATRSLVTSDTTLNDPQAFVEAFLSAYPNANSTLVHPEDARAFLEICRMPGKPVPFVPVIDADVRRWYKADSLWQAHSNHYNAEQALTIPGPAAVSAIVEPNTPVAKLLAGFEEHAVAALKGKGSAMRRARVTAERHAAPRQLHATNGTLTCDANTLAHAWFADLSALGWGPIAAALSVQDASLLGAEGQQTTTNPLRQLLTPRDGVSVAYEQDSEGRLVSLVAKDAQGEFARISLTHGLTQLRATLVAQSLHGEAELDLALNWTETPESGYLTHHRPEYKQSQAQFYSQLLFGKNQQAALPFTQVTRSFDVSRDAIQAYLLATGDDSRGLVEPRKRAHAPVNFAFAAAWEAAFTALLGAAPDLVSLLHEDNDIQTRAGWPIVEGDHLTVCARIVHTEALPEGQRYRSVATLQRGSQDVASLTSSFFIRAPLDGAAGMNDSRTPLQRTLRLDDAAALRFLSQQPWLSVKPGVTLETGCELQLTCEVYRESQQEHVAQGALWQNNQLVATLDLADTKPGLKHPVRTVCDLLAASSSERPLSPARDLGTLSIKAPLQMNAYAQASLDFNPIHTRAAVARFVGLSAPIVHGMWTAAASTHRTIALACDGDANRLRSVQIQFVAPVLPGALLDVSARQVAMHNGLRKIELETRLQDSQELVVKGTLWATAPKTGYVFPGQGLQRQGMGMAGYARSIAARAVWDEADRACQSTLGFSLLHVVQNNPQELLVSGEICRHPKGVLFLTQFTQVAMAVMAVAQVRELNEVGVFDHTAMFAGHSVGEYAALAAVAQTLPLSALVTVVYERGRTMHTLVKRDAQGRSSYAMGVIRPQYAGLTEVTAQALVQQVADQTQLHLQIVNYNIRGKQYAVTGHVKALRLLEQRLTQAQAQAGQDKPAYVEVPGIDVPFHSSVLLDGVPTFRTSLERALPKTLDFSALVQRYIPNLVAKPFALTREFAECVLAASGSPAVSRLLEDWQTAAAQPAQLARTLLVELLAYQFASPVRWIETQDLLLGDGGVEQLVEIGLAEQPVLANMAQATLAQQPYRAYQVRILNNEANLADLFGPAAQQPAKAIVVAEVLPTAATALLATQRPTTPATSLTDITPSVSDALTVLLALQSKVRIDQLRQDESLDELLGGNSARRNQVLADVGAEFSVGAIDGAYEIPLAQFATKLTERASSYQMPGKYLGASVDQALVKLFGLARMNRTDVERYLAQTWGLGTGRVSAVLLELTLYARTGASARGGNLVDLAEGAAAPKDKVSAEALLDAVVQAYGARKQEALHKPTLQSSQTIAVDAEALRELENKLFGNEGLLSKTAALWTQATKSRESSTVQTPDIAPWVDVLKREHSEAYANLIAPCFDPFKHVAFTSAWAWSQRDLTALYHQLMRNDVVQDAQFVSLANRLAPTDHATVAALAKRATIQGREDVAQKLGQLLQHPAPGCFVPRFVPEAPTLIVDRDGLHSATTTRRGETTPKAFVDAVLNCYLQPVRARQNSTGNAVEAYAHGLRNLAQQGVSFAGQTALVTGASPNSIALEVVRALLEGGARVVVTTTSYTPERVAFFKSLYQAHGSASAELHVVPCNQGSFSDIDALMEWMTSTRTETVGAAEKQVKSAWLPDMVLPFGAMGELGDITMLGERSLAVLRVLLLGVERLVAQAALASSRSGTPEKRCLVLLPLSPNHGAFGGDGIYGESKAALETLFNKWHAESAAWGQHTALVGARIGWVRGTGLMHGNDVLAAPLEADTGVRTFSPREMGLLLTGLLTQEVRAEAAKQPLVADITGGFARVPNLAQHTTNLRLKLTQQVAEEKRYAALSRALREAVGSQPVEQRIVHPKPQALSTLHIPTPETLEKLPHLDHLDPQQVVVVVGYGEVSPWGSARTRWQMEKDGVLSLEAVLELAWMTGLVRPQKSGAGWEDAKTGEAVPTHLLKQRYEQRLLTTCGLRLVEPDVAGFDPQKVRSYIDVHLDQDCTLTVQSAQEAHELYQADNDNTVIAQDAHGTWQVTKKRGAVMRFPKAIGLARRVAGLVPSGWDARRYGISNEMIAQVDRATLFNLVATAEAFLAAGMSPSELYNYLHPARVGCTQSSGIGGQQKLKRLYHDTRDGAERQTDSLQETLINVMAGYVVQSYVGSYGAMNFPVAACATAAVSVSTACDKILRGEADFIVAGGVDDYGEEGAVGFGDMQATASNESMERMGLTPQNLSRPNDARRRGFVEAHGAGALLLARASVAIEAGMPVYGLVGYAGSFSDGIQRSVPAPGLGVLACAAEVASTSTQHACNFDERRTQALAFAHEEPRLAQTLGAQAARDVVLAGQRRLAHTFYESNPTISPLRGALAVFGLGADDIAVVSKHDTSTQANDLNENRLHALLQEQLGRTQALPLLVISQKSLTGHPKGAAAAWQMNGLLQAMADDVLPANRSLDNVDAAMQSAHGMVFTDEKIPLAPQELRVGLVTSLGFGHVGAIVALVHPMFFWRMLPQATRATYELKLTERQARAGQRRQQVLAGHAPLIELTYARPFAGKDGTRAQEQEEVAMLKNAGARLGAGGVFIRETNA